MGDPKRAVHKRVPGSSAYEDLGGVLCLRDGVEVSTDFDELVTCKDCRRQLAARPPADSGAPSPSHRLTFELEDLGRGVLTGAAISRLLSALHHPTGYVREGALRGLAGHMCNEGLRAAVQWVERFDPDEDVRGVALDVLSESAAPAEPPRTCADYGHPGCPICDAIDFDVLPCSPEDDACTQEQFRAAPQEWVGQAQLIGTVRITDDSGRTVALLSAPKDERPVDGAPAAVEPDATHKWTGAELLAAVRESGAFEKAGIDKMLRGLAAMRDEDDAAPPTTPDPSAAEDRARAWTCWRCGPTEPHAIGPQHPRGQGCGACDWTGVDLRRLHGSHPAIRERDEAVAALAEARRELHLANENTEVAQMALTECEAQRDAATARADRVERERDNLGKACAAAMSEALQHAADRDAVAKERDGYKVSHDFAAKQANLFADKYYAVKDELYAMRIRAEAAEAELANRGDEEGVEE